MNGERNNRQDESRITIHDSRVDRAHLWPGVIIGPIVVMGDLTGAYALVPWACESGQHAMLHVVKIVSLTIAMAAALYSWHEWRLAGAVLPDDRGGPIVRTRFLALLGTGLSATSALVIFAEWMTTFGIPPCLR